MTLAKTTARFEFQLHRPLARGPLILPQGRQRQIAPLVGSIGLTAEQQRRCDAAWQSPLQKLRPEMPLIVESFAAHTGQTPLQSPQDWLVLLSSGQLSALSGAFAVAWQQGPESLTLLRDPMGERTLFYARIGQGLIFASSLELLLQSGLIQRALNLDVLTRYLSYAYLPGRETLVQGVNELLPGEKLCWQAGQIECENYWQLPPAEPELDPEIARLGLRAAIEVAVERRLPLQAEVCASLSGGIDSSLVVALLARLSPRPVYTWSVSFGKAYRNELPFSQAVAEVYQTRHRVLEVHPRTVLYFLDETMALLGNPIGDPLTVPNALLFRAASEVGPVLFNGEGGDPLFGGPKNIPMLLALLYASEDSDPLTSTILTYLQSYRKLYNDLPQLLNCTTQAALTPDLLTTDLLPWFESGAGQSLVQKLMAVNTRLKGAHHILYKVNALSRGLGMLPASPLFDSEVAQWAFRVPPQLKLMGSEEKYILKQAVSDLLPEQVLKRPKSGMQVPVELWFRPGGPLHREAKKRLKNLARYPWFNPVYLNQLMNWELGGYLPRHGLKVWILLSLEAWLRHYLGPP
ncbi:MAG: asparagine synthetase B [Candidatus Sericytochromatia bacterium]